MSGQVLLSNGNRWYSYSGLVFGDASVPATIPLIRIPNVGLRDSLVKIQPFFGLPPNVNPNEGLGIQIYIDDTIVYEFKSPDSYYRNIQVPIDLFVPRQTELLVFSLNTSGNNSQARGCTVLGYYV